jgi:hypothetical protein
VESDHFEAQSLRKVLPILLYRLHGLERYTGAPPRGGPARYGMGRSNMAGVMCP